LAPESDANTHETVTLRVKAAPNVFEFAAVKLALEDTIRDTVVIALGVSPARVQLSSITRSVEQPSTGMVSVSFPALNTSAVRCNDDASATRLAAVLAAVAEEQITGEFAFVAKLWLGEHTETASATSEEPAANDMLSYFVYVLMGLLGVVMVVAVVYVKFVAKDELSKLGPLATCLVSLLDITTDIVFALELGNSPALLNFAVASLVLSALGNVLGVMSIIRAELQQERFTKWMEGNLVITAAVGFAALSNAECLGTYTALLRTLVTACACRARAVS
jgi:hypothetical protein